MKLLICALSFISLAQASSNIKDVDQIKSMKLDGDTYTVLFWNQAQVYKVPKKSKVVPCLENALKAQKGVALEIDPHHGELLDCKLASGKLPGATTKKKIISDPVTQDNLTFKSCLTNSLIRP